MLTVSAPGPVDIGHRHAQAGRARARRARRDRHQQAGDQPQHQEHGGGGRDIDDGDAPVIGQEYRKRRQDDDGGGGQRDVDRARPARLRRDHVAEQRAHRHVMRAAERPEREGERGQQPVEQRQGQFVGMHCRHDRKRDDRAQRPRHDEWQQRAERDADAAADQRHQHHLREIDGEDAAAAGAERLHGGDGFAPPLEMAFHRVADADPADQQRGQSDDGEELREAFDVLLEPRRHLVARAHVPAGLGQLHARGLLHGLQRRVAGIAASRSR